MGGIILPKKNGTNPSYGEYEFRRKLKSFINNLIYRHDSYLL